MDQGRILDDVRHWATTDENVRLVVLTGSVAREGHAADELSDLDIELYVLDTAPLPNHREWYQRFGQVLVVEELENPDWHYVDGKIDFMVAQVEAAKRGIGYTRAYRVIVDKDELSDHLHLTSDPKARPPIAAEFVRCINWFYAAALMCAKCSARNEPWMAKVRDEGLKTELLQMIE
jgi:aminoglycoside 6-adenylyltransferase